MRRATDSTDISIKHTLVREECVVPAHRIRDSTLSIATATDGGMDFEMQGVNKTVPRDCANVATVNHGNYDSLCVNMKATSTSAGASANTRGEQQQLEIQQMIVANEAPDGESTGAFPYIRNARI